jgi:hypothetical protein
MNRRLDGSQSSLDVREGNSAFVWVKYNFTLLLSHYSDWAMLMMVEDSRKIRTAVECVTRDYKYVATAS